MCHHFATHLTHRQNDPLCRGFLEEIQNLGAIVHEQILGLAIEDHLVRRTIEARLLKAAECRPAGTLDRCLDLVDDKIEGRHLQ